MTSATHPMIYASLAKVMAEVGHIGKTRKNQAQNYQFRGVDDVVAHVQDIMAQHGVLCVPRVVERERDIVPSKSGGSMASVRLLVEHTFFAADGSSVVCTTLGEAMDSGDKASNKAMSAALKYALTETLLIPTYEVDRDTEEHSPQVAPPAPKAPPAPASKPSPPSNVTPIGTSGFRPAAGVAPSAGASRATSASVSGGSAPLEAQIAEWAQKFAQCATLDALDAAGRELAQSRNTQLKAACRGAFDMRREVLRKAAS